MPDLILAAQYVRMSTEHQQYSTQNQMDAIRQYAMSHGMEIVRTYADEGKSGLSLSGRKGLQELLHDIEARQANFSVVLIYDVSRFGRFQDADESAYYEYVCKRSDVQIHYCAEQFKNDGSLSSALIKTMKRSMAAEYSRELSAKVFAGQCRLIELGFRQGGAPGYGLRRQLLDSQRRPKAILKDREYKSIMTDRVILVPGPEEEVRIVREIFDLFTRDHKIEIEIAALLNGRGVLHRHNRPWTRDAVQRVLTSPKYAGVNVYNRESFKLGRKRVANPPDMWICCENAFTPVITREQFNEAVALMQKREHDLTDQELLEGLKQLFARHGTLSVVLIDEAGDLPPAIVYRRRFGTLIRAYSLVGYRPKRDYRYIEKNRTLRKYHAEQCAEIIGRLKQAGANVTQNSDNDLLTINEEFTVSLVLARCRDRKGRYRWLIRLDNSLDPDVTIAARLNPGDSSILDYYLLPRMDFLSDELWLSADNAMALDAYRFDDLGFVMSMSRRVPIVEAA